ncbi:type VI secretion system protein VasD [Pseudacidovorax sp. 1753]|uniref:type VI secretion system lipoprotein TssJ n=1 Tax=Pseudacidovorax sp. 1753 TaxID=3156419 RepID=UPI003391E8A6
MGIHLLAIRVRAALSLPVRTCLSCVRSALISGVAGMVGVLAPCTPAQAQFAYPREQTRLEIRVSAAEDVNPDEKGRAAPIMVRLYELKGDAVFLAADYFSLQNSDKAVLADDLLVRDEMVLKPGETRVLRRRSHPDVNAIGVVAGYKDLVNSDWRAVQKIEPAPEAAWYRAVLPSNKASLDIRIGSRGVRVLQRE